MNIIAIYLTLHNEHYLPHNTIEKWEGAIIHKFNKFDQPLVIGNLVHVWKVIFFSGIELSDLGLRLVFFFPTINFKDW